MTAQLRKLRARVHDAVEMLLAIGGEKVIGVWTERQQTQRLLQQMFLRAALDTWSTWAKTS